MQKHIEKMVMFASRPSGDGASIMQVLNKTNKTYYITLPRNLVSLPMNSLKKHNNNA